MKPELADLLADAVFGFHFIWIVVMFAGFFCGKRNDAFRKLHSAMLATMLTSQVIFLGCPLTLLEQGLRREHEFDGSLVSYLIRTHLNLDIPAWLIAFVLVLLFGISLARVYSSDRQHGLRSHKTSRLKEQV